MMRKPKLETVIALQHLPCSSVRSVPPGCWEHIIFLVNSFPVPPTAFLIKSKCLSICPRDITLALSIPAASVRWYASFAQKVPPSLRVFLDHPGVDETVALESGRPESNGGSTISLACNPGPVSKPSVS